jgi:hypothetical protein
MITMREPDITVVSSLVPMSGAGYFAGAFRQRGSRPGTGERTSIDHRSRVRSMARSAVTSSVRRTREQLDDLLGAADVRLDTATLEEDRGFDPWRFEPKARQRA